MKKYLFYCSQLYCLSIFRPLQQAIRDRGFEAAWFFVDVGMGVDNLDSNEKLLKTVQDVKNYNPDAVFSPVTLVPDFFPGLKVHVFHGLATDQTGKKGHFRVRGLYDLYCTRGEEETRFFSSAAEKLHHFEVVETGWPKLDPLFAGRDTNDIRQGLNTDKPIVFYASTFSPSLTSAPYLVDTIRQLSRTGRYHWLVTLHPKSDPEVMSQYRVLEGPDLTFFESNQDILPLLRAGDVMLCDTSSIAIEFMLLEKPVVTFRTKAPAPYLLNVTEITGIESALAAALTRPEPEMKAMHQFVTAIHPYRDGKSSERVLDATDALIEKGTGYLSNKPLNLLRKYRIRKQLSYYRFS
jgi:CDP-glycerol glycerophosphotransferase (TagB/SpsB family)